MAAPLPGLSVTFCSEVTGLAVDAALGGASDLPLQAAASAMHVARAILGKFMDAMDDIIMEFAEGGASSDRVRGARVRARSGDAAQQRGAYGAGRSAAGDREADLLAPAHGEQPQCTDCIVDFVNHLKH